MVCVVGIYSLLCTYDVFFVSRTLSMSRPSYVYLFASSACQFVNTAVVMYISFVCVLFKTVPNLVAGFKCCIYVVFGEEVFQTVRFFAYACQCYPCLVCVVVSVFVGFVFVL